MKRRRSWGAVWAALLCVTAAAAWVSGVDLTVLIRRGNKFFDIGRAMFPPDLSFAGRVAGPLLSTVQMAFSGTVLGAFAGMALACAASEQFHGCRLLCLLLRAGIQLVRTIPVLILALLATFLIGMGTLAGTAAIFLSTTVILAKLTYEDMDHAPDGAYLALKQSGISPARAAARTVLPEIMPAYLSNSLYLLEANVRSSAILGYVGAGGIGLLLNEKLSWRQYDKVGMVLVLLFFVVAASEAAAESFRVHLKEGGVRRFRWLWLLLFAAAVLSIGKTESAGGIRAARAMISGLLCPDWSMFSDGGSQGIWRLMFETVCIAWVGTVIGAAISLPLALAGSFRLMPGWAAAAVRLAAAAVRTVPVFIYGLMFLRVTGPGAFAGVLTLGVTSTALLTRRFQEAADSTDLGVWRALRHAGVPWTVSVRRALLPQLAPSFAAAVLYRFDVNIREASVLGMVGAGGIGAPLVMAMNQYKWNQAGALLLGLAVMVLFTSGCSSSLSRKLKGMERTAG